MALENKFSEVAENRFYSLAFHRFLNEGRLVGSECRTCGHTSVPPKPVCLKCRGNDLSLREMEGKGRLAAFTVITVAPPFMAAEGFHRKNPYCSGVVELDEGPRVIARILGLDLSRPEHIRVGTPLTVAYVDADHGGEKRTFLAFRPMA